MKWITIIVLKIIKLSVVGQILKLIQFKESKQI